MWGISLSDALEKEGFSIEIINQAEYGNHIVAKIGKRERQSRSGGTHGYGLPEGTVKERPFTVRENRAYGPG